MNVMEMANAVLDTHFVRRVVTSLGRDHPVSQGIKKTRKYYKSLICLGVDFNFQPTFIKP